MNGADMLQWIPDGAGWVAAIAVFATSVHMHIKGLSLEIKKIDASVRAMNGELMSKEMCTEKERRIEGEICTVAKRVNVIEESLRHG